MTAHRVRHHRVFMQASIIVSVVVFMSGCVSTDTHQKALDELTKAKQLSASQAEELEALKKKTKAESDQLQQQLAGLQQNLDQETNQRKSAEQQAASLEKEREALKARSTELQGKLDSLEREKSQLNSDLGDVRAQIAALEKKLADESAQVTALENDKQQLASGTATAQSEIVKLQQRAAELEAESARVAREREQLRQEQNRLAANLDQERQRLKAETEAKAKLQQEQSQLAASLDEERKRLKAEAEEKARLQQEQSQLTASLDEERKRLKAEAEEKARLEQERAAKEEEIRRLTKTQEDLSRSLKDEIDKGNITIQQVRDRLTINMVDRVLFDSGKADIKPAGLKVLKQVSDVLNKITDKQIRIEGHTDNVPISAKLQDKFKTNWELSAHRATTVVRYLIDNGGVQPQALSAVGYADTHPIASNDSEEGRASNRRIEIILYPKDLSQIAGGLSPTN
ncbi:MAG TPA: OmpA family protein [Nitrospira sp.]|nr:OmpA family protein [Nitrospira sp.]